MPRMTRRGDHAATTQKAPPRRKAEISIDPIYPCERPFETTQEVKEYLSGDTIVCLLCGKRYKMLCKHLIYMHNIDVNTYREKYAIPWTYGLSASAVKERIIAAQRARYISGESPICHYTDKRILNSYKSKYRPRCPTVTKLDMDKMASIPYTEGSCTVCGSTFQKSPKQQLKTMCDKHQLEHAKARASYYDKKRYRSKK